MDQVYMTKMATSFLNELSEIEKQAIIGKALKFIGQGAQHIGGALTKQVPMGMTRSGALASRVGGQGAVAAGGIGKHLKQIYQRGAQGSSGLAGSAGPMLPGATRGGGILGGAKELAKSRYGQMAGALAVPVAAGAAIS